jgi:glycosidase
MDITSLAPTSYSKYLVGDHFRVSLTFASNSPDHKLELVSNLNRSHDNIPLICEDHTYTCKVKLTKSGYFKCHLRYHDVGTKTWKWLRDKDEKKISFTVQVDPAWLSDAVVYNVFVRFFMGKTGASGDTIHPGEGGTFDDVKSHLGALSRMGINTLYFNPIHLIGELYRKYNMMDQLPSYLQPGSPYSIKDYKSIDPELTYDKDTKKHLLSDPQQEFKDLVNAAHEKGIYVIMDLVFNHTAHDFVFQRIRPEWYLYKEHITSLEDPYLYPEDIKIGKPWGDPRHTLSPYDHGLWWDDAAQLNWEYMIPPAPNAPPPNTSLKEMWEYFKSIPKYWIRHFGIDGFRCDIAYRIPTEFWKACIAEAREEAQTLKNNLTGDVVFIGEAYTDGLYELQEAGFAAVYGDFSNKLDKPINLKGYLDYMYNLSGKYFPKGSRWFIFPESHDFARTPAKIVGGRSGDLAAALRANQSRWLLTATLPGVPLIFNGFEKIEWQPINLFSYGAVDWERDVDLRDFITKVNHIRHQHLSLQKGTYNFLATNQGITDTTQIFAYLRKYRGESILVVVNMDIYQTAGPAVIYLPETFSGNFILTDLLTDKTYHWQGRELIVKLDPGQSHLFKVHFNTN